MDAHVTAMDLGTSNTCLARCTDGPVTVLRPEGWHNTALGGAVPTLVLYRDATPLCIGAAAELEFGEASEAERARYTLRGQFKPDIAVRDDARQWMEDFLTLLRSRVEVSGRLLVGIPCQAENHYQQVLRRCLQGTGWEGAQFLREPMGAVIHYIAVGTLPPSLAARGVLTVDFGGGTCDLALLRRAEVAARHGDMLYGGRLFDDLFYQMLLERHPDLETQLHNEGNAYYVHWVACRRAKEDFCNAIRQDRSAAVTVRVRWSRWDGRAAQECAAYMENLRWEDFLTRAGVYTASAELRAQLREHMDRAELSQRARGLLEGRRVDLISWFEEILLGIIADARRESAGTLDDMPLALLTGGSSAWPFVEDMVRQTLGDRARILLGDEPYADIAKGLAQYHVLAERLRRGRQDLQIELPAFMEERIRRRAIRHTLESGADGLMLELGDFLRNVVLLPEFRRYREEGGSLHVLMDNIVAALRREDGRVRGLLEDAMARMARRVAEACRAELRQWFREKGIPIVPERLEQTWLGLEMDAVLTRMGPELGSATFKEGRNAAALTALLTAPSLAALAASSIPLASLVVGIGGLVLMKLFHLDRWVVEKSLYLPVPGPLRRKLFAEGRLEALCVEQIEAFGASFKARLLEQWSEAEGRVLAEAGRVAAEEIAALDILNISPL